MAPECSSLVFDLDGTISDPSTGITRSFNHALRSQGLPEVSEDLIQAEIGPPLDETFLKLVPGASVSTIERLIANYRERYSKIGFSENTLYPGIPAALERLRALGIPLGVCTSKRQDFALRILSLFGLEEYFGFVDGGDIGITKQAQLTGLLDTRTIDRNAIMIGDRSVDIVAAHRNSLNAIGVTWGFGDYVELSAESPLRILNNPAELTDIITQPEIHL
jgi:phosphoglycolate phosphatase